MKMALTAGWDVDVERGPDWLFVRIHAPETRLGDQEMQLAERLWDLVQQSFSPRLLVELDQLPMLTSYLIGQLVMLHKRIVSRGGIMRISGLSDEGERVLKIYRLHDRLYPFRSREEAILGTVPRKPR